jgi:hypothetical protein
VRAAVFAAIIGVVGATRAHAQPTDVDKPAAQRLFEEGRRDLEAGNTNAACKKFEQSIRKDPRAVGTLLNLALCNERLGKLATALSLFVEAFDRATEAGQNEQSEAAEQHIQSLRPQVPVVAISYADVPVTGEKLVVDDKVIARDDTEITLDPGPHSIVFTAPGRVSYETALVTKAASRTPLALPALGLPARAASPRRLAGKVMTIGGGGLVVTSIVLAVIAKRKYDAQFEGSMPHCGTAPPIDGRNVCDQVGADAIATSQNYATTATVVGGIGIASAAVGLALWLTAPSESARVVPAATATGASVSIIGRF